MEIVALITSFLGVALLCLTQFFDWGRRKREEEKRKKELIESEQKVIDTVIDRLKNLAKKQNQGVQSVEDQVDAAVSAVGENRKT